MRLITGSSKVSCAMAVRTQGDRILDSVVAALRKQNLVVDFKVRRSIRCTVKRRRLATVLASTFRSEKDLCDHVGVSQKYGSCNSDLLRFYWRNAKSRQSSGTGACD